MIKHKKLLLITILSLTLLLFTGQLIQDTIVFDRSKINSGQWWLIFAGNFTHSNYPHLFLNLSGLWILCLLFIDNLKFKTFIIWTFFLGIVVGLGLYTFNPELEKYYGFSGVLYGLYFVSGVNATFHDDRFTGIAVVILILGKITWDFIYGASTTNEELIGIPVATDAHLYGLIGATIISLILFLKYRLKPH